MAEAGPELDPEQGVEQESLPSPAQVGRNSSRLFPRPGADSSVLKGVGTGREPPPHPALCPCLVQGSNPCHFSPFQPKTTSQVLENGEEVPGPGPSLDRMLSSSSSVSSLNSSTVKD